MGSEANEAGSRPGVLDMLHNSFRFQGGNEFTLPVGFQQVLDGDLPQDFSEFQESEEGSYYQGILTASVVLLIIFLAWFIALPFACCCKKTKCCIPACKNTFFFFALGCSVFGWFMSLRGNDLMQTGFEDGLSIVDTLDENSGELDFALTEILASIPILETQVDNVTDICSQIPGNEGFQINFDPQDLLILEEPQRIVDDFQQYLLEAQNATDDQTETTAKAYSQMTALVITFEVVFGLTTFFALLFKDSEKGVFLKLNSCLNCFGCILIFTIGLLFVITTMVFCIIIAPLATVGADICSPSASENFLREMVENEPNPGLDFCSIANEANADSLSDIETAASFTCHYTKCEGTNIAFLLGGISRDPLSIPLVDDLKQEITDARQDLTLAIALGLPNAVECQEAVDIAEPIVLDLESLALQALALFDCSEMTPIVQKGIEETGCNGVVAGLGVIYVTWTLGTVGLMAAMFTYATLDFERESDRSKRLTMEEANAYVNNESTDNLDYGNLPEAKLVKGDDDHEVRGAYKKEMPSF